MVGSCFVRTACERVSTAGIRMCSWRWWSTGRPGASSPRWAPPPSPSAGWSPRWSWSAARGLWSPSSAARTRTNSTTSLLKKQTWTEGRTSSRWKSKKRTRKWRSALKRFQARVVRFPALSDLSLHDHYTKEDERDVAQVRRLSWIHVSVSSTRIVRSEHELVSHDHDRGKQTRQTCHAAKKKRHESRARSVLSGQQNARCRLHTRAFCFILQNVENTTTVNDTVRPGEFWECRSGCNTVVPIFRFCTHFSPTLIQLNPHAQKSKNNTPPRSPCGGFHLEIEATSDDHMCTPTFINTLPPTTGAEMTYSASFGDRK